MYSTLAGMPALLSSKHTYHYASKDVSIVAWQSPGTEHVRAVVLLGTVQIGKLAEWVAAACPAGTVVIEGAPHWQASADGSDIPEFMAEYSRQSLCHVLETYHPDRLHIIAESQAVPGMLMAVIDKRYRKHIAKLTLLQPLGFNAAGFGQTDTTRIRTFKRRIAQNMRHQIRSLITDSRLRYNHRQLLQIIDMKSSEALAQYDSGLRYDALPDLQRVCAMHIPIHVICGGKDMLFRPAEIQSAFALSHTAVPVMTIPGVPHSPLATRHGIQLLHAAFYEN